MSLAVYFVFHVWSPEGWPSRSASFLILYVVPGMVPPPAALPPIIVSEPMTGSALPNDATALAVVKPLLAARESLLRTHRKATCWLFFREVGVRHATGGTPGMETLMACRICRPDVVDADAWALVRGSRSGLVRYSNTSGTSSMRTHVKNCHRKEAMALDRAVALVSPDGGDTDREVAGVASSTTGSTGKRSAPAESATEASKRMKGDSKAEILLSIQEIEGTIASLSGAVDELKRKVSMSF